MATIVRLRVQSTFFALIAIVIASVLVNIPTASAQTSTATYQAQVLSLVNKHRRAAGCRDLVNNSALASAAQAHASDMARNNYFSHTSRNGTSFTTRITNAGYRYSRAAENIAAGYRTPETVVAGWMQSPGHRANILDCRLTQSGVGYAYNSASRYGSYWVQDFGTPR